MCGPAKDQETTVFDEPCRCCTSKVGSCATGQPDNWTHPDNAKNYHNQETNHSPGQVLPQSTCCDSKDKDIKECEETDKVCGSSGSEDDCKDGCCDDKNTVNEDEGRKDGYCSVDDVSENVKEIEDGCCPSSIGDDTSEDEPTCKSACCESVVHKTIEDGRGIQDATRPTSITDHHPSSESCSPKDNNMNAARASAKPKIKRCSTSGDTIYEADTPRAGCFPKVPLLNAEKSPSCSTSTKLEFSGCGSTIPQVIVNPKKGCCGPKSVTRDTPLQEGKASGCCSTTQPARYDDGACDNKLMDDADCSRPTEDKMISDTKSCCTGDSPVQSDKGCCSKGPRKGIPGEPSKSKSKSSKSKSRAASLGMKEEAMCPCCVQSMLKLNLTVLNTVLSRVNEAQEKFKRCCIAFADLCCAQSKTETGCCETACQDEHGILVPHLDYSDGTYASNKAAEGLKAKKEGAEFVDKGKEADIGEKIVLEVIGMDCPDCLSKVTQAVRILSGAEVTNADGVRGLVNVKYDPRMVDLKAIQTFTARASGFKINILDGSNHFNKPKVLVLPLTLTSMPPQSVLDKYETTSVQGPYKRWLDLSGRTSSGRGAQLDLVLHLDSYEPIQPRIVLKELAIYGTSLRPQSTDQNSARIHRDLRNIAFRTLASLILTIPILVLVWSPRPLASPNVSHGVQLALATLIVLVAWPIYSGSFRSAYYLHRADLGVLTSFSTLTSYIFSVIAFGFQDAGRDIGEPFFETVGLLITLIFAGRTLQAGTRKFGLKAVDNLGKLQPQSAKLVDQVERDIDVRLLHYDDIVRIRTGEVVPTDGVVVEGHGTVDESSLTGESVPVAKSPGSSLTAGTKLQDGQLDIVVTRLIPENSISTIVDAVSSSSTGSEYQDLADRMAGWLLPIAGACCLAAFIGWMLVERFRRNQSWGEAVISGVGYAIAIAAVSCPCALAIAVTLVTSVSMAATVQDGILFRSTQALLTAHAVKAIAFDKTGTLSQGLMTVQQTSYDQDPQSIQLIHAITAASKHPVSETAKRYIESQHQLSQETQGLEDIDIVPGKGVTATFFGFPVMAGNAEFTDTAHHPLVKEYLSEGMTILVITLGGQLIGLFGMKDQPRSGVNELVTNLEGQGKQVSLVSGDNYSAVHSFAQIVGISHNNVHASQTPVSKGEVVQHVKDDTSGLVAFVGDGINDTIALSTADISIATGSASNASSQIIILSSDVPKAVYQILNTSQMTKNHVVVSLTFCGIYFAAAILLASGISGWRIPPAFAGLGELVSILPVLLVAGHLAIFKSIQRWFERRAGREVL